MHISIGCFLDKSVHDDLELEESYGILIHNDKDNHLFSLELQAMIIKTRNVYLKSKEGIL